MKDKKSDVTEKDLDKLATNPEELNKRAIISKILSDSSVPKITPNKKDKP